MLCRVFLKLLCDLLQLVFSWRNADALLDREDLCLRQVLHVFRLNLLILLQERVVELGVLLQILLRLLDLGLETLQILEMSRALGLNCINFGLRGAPSSLQAVSSCQPTV